MKLSIVIPMFNAENYVLRCLDSLLDQNLSKSEYEIIIIDDGSTDNSANIVKKIALNNHNIKIHITENYGISSARNTGSKLAKGNYIFFVDADDYITSNSLTILTELALKNNLDILGFRMTRTTDLNLNKVNDISHRDGNLKIQNGINYIENYNYYKDGCWWYFIRRNYLVNIGLEFYINRYLQDTIFTAELFIKAKKVSFIPLDVYRYVINPNSVWTNKTPKHLRKIVDDFTFISIKYNNLLKSHDNQKLVDRLSHNRDQMVLNLMKRIFESTLTITEIKEVLNLLKREGLYPLNNFDLKSYKRFRVWFLTNVFKKENRYLGALIVKRKFKSIQNTLNTKFNIELI